MLSLALAGSGCAIDDHDFYGTAVGWIVAEPSIIEVTEGQESAFNVRIGMPPAGTTEVDCSPERPELISTSSTLVFTEANAGVDQMVTVRGLQDLDLEGWPTKVICTSGDLEPGVVNINLRDDDRQKVIASPDELALEEGESRFSQVRLQFMSGHTEVTAVASTPDVMVAPTTLVFESGNYDVPQNLLIQGVIDADTTDDTATVTLTVPGGDPLVMSITVREAD